ncbi:hypothetical protein Sjap_016110 [Stephania japonica]|uniref:protein-disulfide reductase n=1 Tax=Stephania japonica TaxID=461633 RepID=A0AAP0IKH5_9MAGN
MATIEDHAPKSHDLKTLLSSDGRDFLVRSNSDDQVTKSSELIGKTVGLYFSASWCGPCRRFTPKLIETYNDLYLENDFEVVFVSADRDEDSFSEYLAKMPWLAIPCSDGDARDRMYKLFEVKEIPRLVILDASGKVVSEEGVGIVGEYGSEGHPFTEERIKSLKDNGNV